MLDNLTDQERKELAEFIAKTEAELNADRRPRRTRKKPTG